MEKNRLRETRTLTTGGRWKRPAVAMAMAAMIMFTGMPMSSHAASEDAQQTGALDEVVQVMDGKGVAQDSVITAYGYQDVSAAYVELNNFRTTANVWQWNEDNKTKTVFNNGSGVRLGQLNINSALEQTAKTRAKEIAESFSHTRPDGSKCFTAYPAEFAYKGENIACGHDSASAVTTAWEEEDQIYEKQGHRRNMLNSNFNAVGIACYVKDGVKYWVQCFGGSTNNSGDSGSVNVSKPIQKVVLNKTSLALKAGQSQTLTVSITPSDTTDDKTVKWSTSNNKVATVSAGKVTAKTAGTATISAKVGSKTAKCTVSVKAADGYRDASEAYTIINKFRTKKGVWQWNKDNKTKTYFNTKAKNKLKELKKSASLEKTAKKRAKEIATKYSHTRPNGSSCFTIYPKCCFKGENIAKGHKTASAVSVAWAEKNEKYDGQGHRRNMLNKHYTHVGIACYEKDGVKYWVQCFGGK